MGPSQYSCFHSLIVFLRLRLSIILVVGHIVRLPVVAAIDLFSRNGACTWELLCHQCLHATLLALWQTMHPGKLVIIHVSLQLSGPLIYFFLALGVESQSPTNGHVLAWVA
jgi:hypothetical protein